MAHSRRDGGRARLDQGAAGDGRSLLLLPGISEVGGHAASDQRLKKIAERIREKTKNHD